METIVRRFSIGPGAIAASSSLPERNAGLRAFEIREGGPDRAGASPFAMSAAEWLEIQLYVEKGLALPDTADKLLRKLQLSPSTDLRPYADLLAVYHGINTHVSEWKNTLFPESVSLASDVCTYALKARSHYEPILRWTEILLGNPADAEAKKQLHLLMTTLSQTVRAYQERCGKVAGQIQTFANQTLLDRISLNGADGKSGLLGAYRNRYKDAADATTCIKARIEDDYQLLRNLTGEYTYYVAEAAKTASYVWIWPFGTIAAGIKAGEYGKKASDALNRIRKTEQDVNNLSGQLSLQTRTLCILEAILTDTSGISTPLSRGLSIIQSMEGSWKAIADDFDALTALVARNIAEALPCIRDLGVEAAVRSWEAVGKSADGYRQHAYIQINP